MLLNKLTDGEERHRPLAHKWNQKFFDTDIPLNAIRDYYGEKIAMYFSFAAFSANSYLWPGVIGLVVFIIQRIYSKDHDEELVIIMNALFTLIFCCWCTFYLEMWNRKQCVNAVDWGSADTKATEVSRPEFHGKDRRSPITDEMESTYYSTFRRKRI